MHRGNIRTYLPCIYFDFRIRHRSQDSYSNDFVKPVVFLAAGHKREVNVSNAAGLWPTSSLVELDISPVICFEGLAHVGVEISLSVYQVPVSTGSNNSAYHGLILGKQRSIYVQNKIPFIFGPEKVPPVRGVKVRLPKGVAPKSIGVEPVKVTE